MTNFPTKFCIFVVGCQSMGQLANFFVYIIFGVTIFKILFLKKKIGSHFQGESFLWVTIYLVLNAAGIHSCPVRI